MRSINRTGPDDGKPSTPASTLSARRTVIDQMKMTVFQPRCQAPLVNRFSPILWRSLVRYLFLFPNFLPDIHIQLARQALAHGQL